MDQVINSTGENFFVDDAGLHHRKEDCKGLVNTKQLDTARLFLDLMTKKRKTVNKYNSSYNIKHIAENFGEKLTKKYSFNTESYISNGALILAAYSFGFTIFHVNGLNCYFNISIR